VVAHVEAHVEATREVALLAPDAVVETEETTEQMITTHPVRYQATRHRCGTRHCGSLCHLTGNKAGRFWFLEYTPLSILLTRPDNGNCESGQFCLSLRLALSNYGIPFALIAGLNITSDPTGVTLRPSLRTERTVKYTSPGFETLVRLKHDNITVDEAKRRFIKLFRSDSSFKDHRDPSGKGYLQVTHLLSYVGCVRLFIRSADVVLPQRLLEYPWRPSYDQFALFDLFTEEFGMRLYDQDKGLSLPSCWSTHSVRRSSRRNPDRKSRANCPLSSFLTTCAKWIGEGPHLVLLSDVLRCGFDPTAVDSPLWKDWPRPCSPGWVSEEVTPDPFFVQYLSMLVKDDPGRLSV